MDQDPSVIEPGPDRLLAGLALVLVLTAFWLPWWVVRLRDTEGTTTSSFGLFHPFQPVTTSWAPHLTGGLLVLVALGLFLLLAGRSWAYEPRVWQKGLLVAAGGAALSLLLLVAWPSSIPEAWGRRTLVSETDGSWVATETANPGSAWWLVFVALVCLVAAWWLHRSRAAALDPSDK